MGRSDKRAKWEDGGCYLGLYSFTRDMRKDEDIIALLTTGDSPSDTVFVISKSSPISSLFFFFFFFSFFFSDLIEVEGVSGVDEADEAPLNLRCKIQQYE